MRVAEFFRPTVMSCGAAPSSYSTRFLVSVDHAVVPVDGGDTYAPVPDAAWRVTEDTPWRTSASGLRYRIRTYTRGAR